jgi:hypothetical protein
VERLRALVSPRSLLAAWCLTIVGASVLLGLEVHLRTPPAGEGIVALERAGTAARAAAIIGVWRKEGALGEAWASLAIDFPFLALYSTALALTVLWLAFRDWSALGPLGRGARATGVVVALLQWGAGLADVVENVALVIELGWGPTERLAWWADHAAGLKFGLLELGVLYLVAAGLAQGVIVQQRFPLVQYLYFCRFPLLSLLTLVALAPVAILGLPALFRNLFAVKGSGLAVTTALAVLLAWGILLTLLNLLRFAPLRFEVPALPASRLNWLHRRRFAMALSLAAPVTVVAALFEDGYRVRAMLPVGFGLAGALAVLVVAELIQMRWGKETAPPQERVFESGFVPEEPEPHVGHPPPSAAPAWLRRLAPRLPGYFADGRILPGHIHAAVFLGMTLLLYFGLYYPLRPDVAWISLPALAYVLVILTALSWLLPGLSFFLDRFRLPTLALLGAVLLVNSTVLKVDHFYRVFPPSPDGPPAVTPLEALAANDARLGATDRPVVVVAASGGGIRAAVWTAHVLAQLERPENLGPEFPRAVRLVSSVSGGSVGTMFYLDAFGGRGAAEGTVDNSALNALDDAAWGFAYADLWRAFLPVIFNFTDRGVDRGWALEEVWRRRLSDADLRISSWRRAVAEGSLPPAVLNATIAENGAQLLLTPLEVPRAWRARSLQDAQGLLDLRVSTAARLSATFPWVSPMAIAGLDQGGRRLARPERPGPHVGDGGYYDNFGVASAVNWVETVLAGREAAFSRRGILVVVISASPFGPFDHDPPSQGERGWFYATVGPLVALAHVRGSTQLMRNRVELDLMQQKWRLRGVPFTYVIFEPSGPGPLSWKLTEHERQRVLAHWGESPNPERLADLRRCFLDMRSCQGEPRPPMPEGPALLGDMPAKPLPP